MCLHPDKSGGGGFGLSSQTTKKSQSDCQRGEDREGGRERASSASDSSPTHTHSSLPPSCVPSFSCVLRCLGLLSSASFLPSSFRSSYVYYLLHALDFFRARSFHDANHRKTNKIYLVPKIFPVDLYFVARQRNSWQFLQIIYGG